MAANVREARGDLSYTELSRRLAALDTYGRAISPVGLRHIETRQRRVDVAELIALARVLEVPAMNLLVPRDPDDVKATVEMLQLVTSGPKGI